jgi:6-phosphogluconate dehydrogenase (decarboxylating)
MGFPMSGNLVKKGFDVKAYDVNPQTLDKCSEYVRYWVIVNKYGCSGGETSKDYC